MDFIAESIAAYSEKHTQNESPVLRALNRETNAKILQPRMLSGHLQGRALSMFSKMVNPQYILEIGTYTGYSAICLAEGLQIEGELYTIDINEELSDMANGYFAQAGFEKEIKHIVGDALEIIPILKRNWDLVFIDADKENYSNYFDMVIDSVNKGGYIIADNVLWSGKVVEELKGGDKDTAALIEFNDKVHNDPRVENLLLPIRDGLMILRKV
jgi:caffeoyl-CoA O-methyltransferase